MTSYDELFQYLNKLREQEKLNVYQYSLITDMLRKVTDNLAQSNERASLESNKRLKMNFKFRSAERFS